MKRIILFLLILNSYNLFAQNNYTWYKPSFVHGICVQDTGHIFYRLPSSMQSLVRVPVWALSKNTAGELIHFKTTARTFSVNYVLEGTLNPFHHMSEMGVSGVDLYALDAAGNWHWAPPSYHFGDTCVFTYNNLYLPGNNKLADFYLYLPLYNTVKWLTIGVPDGQHFEFIEQKDEQPIVAYGTSILQGAVASRSGLAWTNIVSRKLDKCVINLGFSGNGRFEKPIFDLMAKVNASLYILDCMPNLAGPAFSAQAIKDSVYYGINKLRNTNASVPILLVGHAVGYAPFYMDTARKNGYHLASLLIGKIYQQLKSDGYRNIYLLTDKEIGFDDNCTAEGLHPNDIGMMRYADAYEKIIRAILHDPKK